MSEKEKRGKLKQDRIMRYFIDSTVEIIKNEGVAGVTIRKVSSQAGYTSATLYNYFDTLDHLVFLANMSSLEKYVESLPSYLENCENSIEVYMSICKCYALHAYENPKIFSSLFFSHHGEDYERYTNQYYELYPQRDKKNRTKFLNKLFHINNLHERRLYLLSYCVSDGYISESNTKDFTDICLRFYKTIISDVIEGILTKEEAIDLTLKYDYKLLSFFVKPEYNYLVDNYLKKLK